jgi:DHA1 family multidrug resistance protein-like MFS transporter
MWAILSRPAVGGIVFVAVTVMFGVGIVLPIVPLFARSLGASLAGAGFFTSIYGLTRLVFDVSGGRLTDRLGVRPVTVGGLVTLAIGSTVTGIMNSYVPALVGWALTGMGSAAVFAGLFAYLLRVVPKNEMARTLGLFYGSFNVGIIAGGPVGGVLAHAFGLSAPFFAYSALLLLAATIYVVVIDPPPPTRPEEGPSPSMLSAVKTLSSSRGFVTACFGGLAYLWLIAGVFDTLLPLKASTQLGMSTLGIGALFGVVTAAELITIYPAGALADSVGRVKVLAISTALLIVATIAAGFATAVFVYGALLCLMCFASGFSGVPPAAMVSDVAPDNLSGTAIGIFRFAGDLGFVLGPLLAGWSAQTIDFPAAFATCTIPSLVTVALAMRTPETLHRGGNDLAAGETAAVPGVAAGSE